MCHILSFPFSMSNTSAPQAVPIRKRWFRRKQWYTCEQQMEHTPHSFLIQHPVLTFSHAWRANPSGAAPGKRRKKGTALKQLRWAWVCLEGPSQQPYQHQQDRDNSGLWADFWVPITSGKIYPSRDVKSKQGLIKMAWDELFIGLFSHF